MDTICSLCKLKRHQSTPGDSSKGGEWTGNPEVSADLSHALSRNIWLTNAMLIQYLYLYVVQVWLDLSRMLPTINFRSSHVIVSLVLQKGKNGLFRLRITDALTKGFWIWLNLTGVLSGKCIQPLTDFPAEQMFGGLRYSSHYSLCFSTSSSRLDNNV